MQGLNNPLCIDFCETFLFRYYAIKSDGYYMYIVPLYFLVTVASETITCATCGELKRHTGWMRIIVRICDFRYTTHVARLS